MHMRRGTDTYSLLLLWLISRPAFVTGTFHRGWDIGVRRQQWVFTAISWHSYRKFVGHKDGPNPPPHRPPSPRVFILVTRILHTAAFVQKSAFILFRLLSDSLVRNWSPQYNTSRCSLKVWSVGNPVYWPEWSQYAEARVDSSDLVNRSYFSSYLKSVYVSYILSKLMLGLLR